MAPFCACRRPFLDPLKSHMMQHYGEQPSLRAKPTKRAKLASTGPASTAWPPQQPSLQQPPLPQPQQPQQHPLGQPLPWQAQLAAQQRAEQQQMMMNHQPEQQPQQPQQPQQHVARQPWAMPLQPEAEARSPFKSPGSLISVDFKPACASRSPHAAMLSQMPHTVSPASSLYASVPQHLIAQQPQPTQSPDPARGMVAGMLFSTSPGN